MLEGQYQFAYEMDMGGGGVCNATGNTINTCAQPGDAYVDNQVFNMTFTICKDVWASFHLSKSNILSSDIIYLYFIEFNSIWY